MSRIRFVAVLVVACLASPPVVHAANYAVFSAVNATRITVGEDDPEGDGRCGGGPLEPWQIGTLPDGSKYIKGRLVILFKEGYEAILDSVRSAADRGGTTTGVDSLDSLGVEYGLRCISGFHAQWDPYSRRLFLLGFSEDLDIVEAIQAYMRLPYVELAEPDIIYHTGMDDTAWGRIKGGFR